MKINIQYTIKAILSGVDESIIDKLDFGNSYTIQKDSLINNKLCKEFDYTFIGIRRIYELSTLNQKLDVALLTKKNCTVKEIITDDDSKLNYDQIYPYISKIEDDELNYVDKTMRNIRLFSENCFNIKEILFKFKIIDLNDNSTIFDNSKIPLPDKIYDNIPKLQIENNVEATKINNFIKDINSKISSSKFLPKKLPQICFLYDQSYTSPVETLRFIVCVIGLESILVNGNSELNYRFRRNGAMLLSNNAEEYKDLSKKLKDLYEKRSRYVHDGNIDNINPSDLIQARDLLRKTIFKILDKNVTKDELMNELDLKGY